MTTSYYPWQRIQWQHFQTERRTDHLPHAILLSGVDGIGKGDFANLLADSLLCEQITGKGFACGRCTSCKLKKSGAHPDYKQVDLPDGKQQIPVSAIRELTDFLVLSRSYGSYRVVVINAADKMNINAANSLLKSLEEPPPKTVIILVVDQLSRLPVTVRSRCQIMTMNKPDYEVALQWLVQQDLECSAEKILSLADSKPLLAKRMGLDKNLLDERKQFAKDIMAVLQHRSGVTTVAKNWEKKDLNNLLNWQMKWVHAVVKSRLVENDEKVTNKFLSLIQANLKHPDVLWKLYSDLLEMKALTEYPLNRLVFTESMLLLWHDVGKTA